MSLKPTFFAGVICLVASPAPANDSTAAFAAGGIHLTKTDVIAMVDEELSISRGEIRVRYVFANRTGSDVQSLIAFPLPDIDLATFSEIPVQQPTSDPDNFVGFTVNVGGEAVAPTLSMHATLEGIDVTESLRKHGLPMSLFADDLYPKLLALSPDDQAAMEAAELAFFEPEYESVYPQWTQHSLFTWTQDFPAGRDTVVEHTYAPVVGNTFVSDYLLQADDEGEAAWLDRYCIDVETKTAIASLLDGLEAAGRDRLAVVDEIGYVLSTGANWAGPIGHLRIRIDIGDPDNLLATCLRGLTRESPTTYSVDLTEFTPDRDLWVLIIRHEPES